MEYIDCKCGSKDTYISFAGDKCCSPCFKALDEKIIKVADMRAGVFADEGGWAVRVDGQLKKYFSKYEDYAHTEAAAYSRKLNLAQISS